MNDAPYIGDFAATQTVSRRFATSDDTDTPITITGTPTAQVRKGSGAGTVITAGVTFTKDVVTGQHVVDVDLTASGSYAAGFDYGVEWSAGVVNGISMVGKPIMSFSIQNRVATAALTAAGVRAAVGLASANLDTQLSTIAGYIDTEVAAIVTAVLAVKAKTDNLPGSPAAVGSAMTLTSGERTDIATAAQDLIDGIEAGYTPRQAQRLMLSALAGKVSGAGAGTPIFRDVNDTKNRISATTDSDGDRSAVTLDAS